MAIKIGLLGAGHLGKIHLKCIGLAENLELVGFYDPNDENAARASGEYGATRFDSIDELMDVVDAVDIVTPTTTHFDLAKKAVARGKHFFIEKPLTQSVEEAETLIRLVEATDLKVQVGHVERFNPAFLSLRGLPLQPMFIEGHRLATFNPRGTDVSVVLDLMIHDLDIVLSAVKSPVKSISASGVAVVSDTPDIANVRLEFENGCVANLTASRISLKQMRKLRFFQPDAYISIDFLEKNAQVVRMFEPNHPDKPDSDQLMELDTPKGKKYIHVDMPQAEPVNAIKMELETFADSILNNTTTRVPIQDGYEALKVAQQILDQIEKRLNALQ